MVEIIDKLSPIGLEDMIYCEPYFGGGAYYFYKKPSRVEAINDTNEILITFFEVTQNMHEFTQLKQMIDNTLHAEHYFNRARLIYNNVVPSGRIEKAWAFWILTNFSFSGSPSGGWKWSNGTNGSSVGVYFQNKKSSYNTSLPERLKYTEISQREALKVIKQRDTKETFFYIDPPYEGADQKHYSGFNTEKFIELLEVLSSLKARFILSNYNSRVLNKYIKANGWTKIEVEMCQKVAHLGSRETNSKKKKTKTEVLVMNYTLQKKQTEIDFG